MLRPISAFFERLDFVYCERPYFDGVKARLLAGFNLILILFVPLNLTKVFWVHAPELQLRLIFNLVLALAALLSLYWVRKGMIERAASMVVLGSLLPVNILVFVVPGYPEPLGAAVQLFALNLVFLLLAVVFASRWVATGALAIIVTGHLGIHRIALGPMPIAGSLRYAANTLFRDGLIAFALVFCIGAMLVWLLEATHNRSEQALRDTRASNENLERLVSERTRDLEAATLRANEASQAKGDFLANMSHEIRTPLNGIIATSDLLRRRADLPVIAAEDARLIAESGELLLKLLGDILDFSKIEAGRLVLENHTFALESLVADTVALLGMKATEGLVQLDCSFAPGLAGDFEGDSFRLRQVLLNLGSNAIKFTPPGGRVQLNVTGAGVQSGVTLIHFEVRDTGIGMDEPTLKRIFERFTQADSSTTRRYGGTGLGLAISSRIVERMDGRLEAESVLGQGSRFQFTVPFKTVETVTTTTLVAAVVSNATPAEALRLGLCVLVAEDNAVNRRILAEQLTMLGCSFTLAVDGREALDALERGLRPDVVLMDCHMPGIDGWAATQHLRGWATAEGVSDLCRKASALPVIALTAAALPEERTRCLDVGMNDFLAKPVKLADLQGALRPFARGLILEKD